MLQTVTSVAFMSACGMHHGKHLHNTGIILPFGSRHSAADVENAPRRAWLVRPTVRTPCLPPAVRVGLEPGARRPG
jgi:hypothetical protein